MASFEYISMLGDDNTFNNENITNTFVNNSFCPCLQNHCLETIVFGYFLKDSIWAVRHFTTTRFENFKH